MRTVHAPGALPASPNLVDPWWVTSTYRLVHVRNAELQQPDTRGRQWAQTNRSLSPCADRPFMTTSPSPHAFPDISTMVRLCQERILLCGPCDTLMSRQDYQDRHERLNDIADGWTEDDRTDFWHTLDALCADWNPYIRATPGLKITPENLAFEDLRLSRISGDLMDPTTEIQGFPVWGFKLYTDPVVYSFSFDERMRYAVARLASVEGATLNDLEAMTAHHLRASEPPQRLR